MKIKFAAILIGVLFSLTGCGFFSKANTVVEEEINRPQDLFSAVEKSLRAGNEEFSFETSELTQEDLEDLNRNLDGYYGVITQYQYKEVGMLQKSYVTLFCEISDNFYVENAILRGTQIPKEREKAKELKEICVEITENVCNKEDTDYQKEEKIHDYLVTHVKYGFPEGDESENSDGYSAYGALLKGEAVCNGYAQAMKLLCDLSGIKCEMITGTSKGENHAWNLVKMDGKWYHVDVTWDDPKPDNPSRILYTYFNVPDRQMGEDHAWEKKYYPKAKGFYYNYYRLNKLSCDSFDQFKEVCISLVSEDMPQHIQLQIRDYDAEIYSEKNLQFLFENSGATSLQFQNSGPDGYTVLYFTLSY